MGKRSQRKSKTGKRELNPTDAYRKQQRNKEKRRNKNERKQVREEASLRKNPQIIKDELTSLSRLAILGQLDAAGYRRREKLEALWEVTKQRAEAEKSAQNTCYNGNFSMNLPDADANVGTDDEKSSVDDSEDESASNFFIDEMDKFEGLTSVVDARYDKNDFESITNDSSEILRNCSFDSADTKTATYFLPTIPTLPTRLPPLSVLRNISSATQNIGKLNSEKNIFLQGSNLQEKSSILNYSIQKNQNEAINNIPVDFTQLRNPEIPILPPPPPPLHDNKEVHSGNISNQKISRTNQSNGENFGLNSAPPLPRGLPPISSFNESSTNAPIFQPQFQPANNDALGNKLRFAVPVVSSINKPLEDSQLLVFGGVSTPKIPPMRMYRMTGGGGEGGIAEGNFKTSSFEKISSSSSSSSHRIMSYFSNAQLNSAGVNSAPTLKNVEKNDFLPENNRILSTVSVKEFSVADQKNIHRKTENHPGDVSASNLPLESQKSANTAALFVPTQLRLQHKDNSKAGKYESHKLSSLNQVTAFSTGLNRFPTAKVTSSSDFSRSKPTSLLKRFESIRYNNSKGVTTGNEVTSSLSSNHISSSSNDMDKAFSDFLKEVENI